MISELALGATMAYRLMSMTLAQTILASVIILAAPNSPAAAATFNYDLAADFSNAANPNGPWAYREGENTLPLTPNWSQIVGVQPAYSREVIGQNFLPVWMQSAFDNPLGADGTVLDALTGDVIVHSTDNFRGPGGIANVIWTSPVDGILEISGSVWMARDIGRSNTWELLLNGNLLSAGSLSSGDPFDRDNPFEFEDGAGLGALSGVPVHIGDVLRLNVTRTSSAGDFVGVNLAISADDVTEVIPLPPTLPALLSALALFALIRRRRGSG